MQRIINLIIFILLATTITFGQGKYFRQKTDYDIFVNLNPLQNTLDGFSYITYHNNSGDNLSELYIYLYANEFKSNNTLLAKELLKNKNVDLYFAKEADFGGYSDINISGKNKNLNWTYYNKNKTLVKIALDNPIKAGDTLKFKVEFTLKIPKCVKGLGYKKGQYNFANWYPKMAVYQKNGWNINEISTGNLLFSDFGDYKVKIRIPENYIVASSGVLKTKKEIEFLKENIINNNQERNIYEGLPIPNYKVLEYEAKNITAFAWYANPRFAIKKLSVSNKNGDSVDLSLYYDYFWIEIKHTKHINTLFNNAMKAIRFYSSEISAYPQNHISIIATEDTDDLYSFSNVITIHLPGNKEASEEESQSLTHFLCYNWLDSYFSINKYSTPWIINGFVCFYHSRYMDKCFKCPKEQRGLRRSIKKLNHLSHFKSANLAKDKYTNYEDQMIFNNFKPAISLNYLNNYMGKERFNQLIHSFFTEYKYKQIGNEDIRNHFEQFTKENLNWFFDGLIGDSNPYKYQITNYRTTDSNYILHINNNGKFKIPIQIGGIKDDSLITSVFVDGFTGEKPVNFEKGDYDKIMIDPNQLYYKTKDLKQSIVLHKKIKAPDWITSFKHFNGYRYVLPFLGFNSNDGLMLGTFIKNSAAKEYNFYFIPMYGLRSKSIVGTMDYKRIMNSPFSSNKIEIGLNARKFHRYYNKGKGFNLKYHRISPYININLGNNEFNTKSKLNYRFSFISDENFTREGTKPAYRYINNIQFSHKGENVITPYKFTIGLEHQLYTSIEKENYLKIQSSINTAFMYKKNRYLRVRIYGATYLFNTNKYSTGTNPGTLSLIGSANNDYEYNHYFIDRSTRSGFWSRQLVMNTGGFKTAIDNSHGIGQSNNYVLSTNIRLDLPIKMFIKPYLDLGIYGDLPTISEGYSNKFIYSSGLVFQFLKDEFEIYLPILNSKEINDIYREQGGGILNRISFMVKLNPSYLSNP